MWGEKKKTDAQVRLSFQIICTLYTVLIHLNLNINAVSATFFIFVSKDLIVVPFSIILLWDQIGECFDILKLPHQKYHLMKL